MSARVSFESRSGKLQGFDHRTLFGRTTSGIICSTTNGFVTSFVGHFARLWTWVTCHPLDLQRIRSSWSFRYCDLILTYGLTWEETTWVFLVRRAISRKFAILTILWRLTLRCNVREASWSYLVFLDHKWGLFVNLILSKVHLAWSLWSL